MDIAAGARIGAPANWGVPGPAQQVSLPLSTVTPSSVDRNLQS